jgi:putative salt-induced outer membrane protein YdiY
MALMVKDINHAGICAKNILLFFFITVALLQISAISSFADVIYLKNNDRLTCVIVYESDDEISVIAESVGKVTINKALIERVERQGQEIVLDRQALPTTVPEKTQSPDNDVLWKREISAGFHRATGNTREDNFAGSLLIHRNHKHVDEWMIKGNMFYSSTKRKMDRQKWFLSGRYAYSFGRDKKWYNFYRLEADHDRFADIDYRFVPAGGFGYWFFDTDKTRLMAEVGAGIERTHFKSNAKDASDWVLIPRAWFEKKIFENITISQGISYYAAFEDFDHYRLRSETACDFLINSQLKLRFSVFDDYNSNPTKDTKKNDLRFMTSLAYSF